MRQPARELPQNAWDAGWRMRMLEWEDSTGSGSPWVLRTLVCPGDLAPSTLPPPWSLHMGLPNVLGLPECTMLANGFRLTFPNLAEPPLITVAFVEPGVLIGRANLRLTPSLFSPQYEIEPLGEGGRIVVGDETICLEIQRDQDSTVFALSRSLSSGAVRPSPVLKAFADIDPETVLERHASRWSKLEESKALTEDRGMLLRSIEMLVYHLRLSPSGTTRWSSFDVGHQSAMHPHHIFPLVTAWAHIDTEIARDLLSTFLAGYGEEELAENVRHIQWDPSVVPLPMVCQATRILADESSAEEEILSHCLPALCRYLQRVLNVVDKDGTGLPAWPNAGSAWIPNTYEAGLTSVDLVAMLLGELNLLIGWIQGDPGRDLDSSYFVEARDRLRQTLHGTLWNSSEKRFLGCHADRSPAERKTLGELLPLLDEELPLDQVESIIAQWKNQDSLFSPGGGLWESWPEKPEPAPVPTAHQFFLLHAFRRDGMEEIHANLLERVLDALHSHFSSEGELVPDLRTDVSKPPDLEMPLWYEDPFFAACLVVVAPSHAGKRTSKLPPWLLAFDQHRHAIATFGFGILAAAVAGFSLFINRPSSAREEKPPEELLKYIRTMSDQGEALALVERIKGRVQEDRLALIRANIYFRQGNFSAAGKAYSKMIENDMETAKATFNLALTRYRQGRLDEAVDLYTRVVETYREENPNITGRAEIAARVIRSYKNTLRFSPSPEKQVEAPSSASKEG